MNQTLRFIGVFVIIIGVMMLISTSMNIERGLRNVDMGQNLRYLSATYDIDFVDVCSDGIERDGTELYVLGMNQLDREHLNIIKWFSLIALGVAIVVAEIDFKICKKCGRMVK